MEDQLMYSIDLVGLATDESSKCVLLMGLFVLRGVNIVFSI